MKESGVLEHANTDSLTLNKLTKEINMQINISIYKMILFEIQIDLYIYRGK